VTQEYARTPLNSTKYAIIIFYGYVADAVLAVITRLWNSAGGKYLPFMRALYRGMIGTIFKYS